MDFEPYQNLPDCSVHQTCAPDVPEKLTYSVAEVSAILEVSQGTIFRLLARGILRPAPGLGRKQFSKTQIHRLALREFRPSLFTLGAPNGKVIITSHGFALAASRKASKE